MPYIGECRQHASGRYHGKDAATAVLFQSASEATHVLGVPGPPPSGSHPLDARLVMADTFGWHAPVGEQADKAGCDACGNAAVNAIASGPAMNPTAGMAIAAPTAATIASTCTPARRMDRRAAALGLCPPASP
jgi:hypothetical protein